MIRSKLLLTAAVFLSSTVAANAQFRGGDSSAMTDRFFGMLDRNQDGRIDEDEARRIPPPFRDAMQKMGVDLRRGLSRDRFAEVMPRAMEEMRRSREASGGFGRPGGFGGPPGGGGGDGRGPGDYRGSYDDRSRDSRYGRSDSRRDSRGRSGRSTPKPKLTEIPQVVQITANTSTAAPTGP